MKAKCPGCGAEYDTETGEARYPGDAATANEDSPEGSVSDDVPPEGEQHNVIISDDAPIVTPKRRGRFFR